MKVSNFRKFSTFFMVAVLLLTTVSLFAGGGSQPARSGSASQPFVVKVWGGVPPESGPQASVDEFNALYKDKGIQAEYTRFVNDSNGNLQLETNLLSGNSVDVYISYGMETLSKRKEGNMALNLSPLIQRDSFDIKGFGDLAEQNKVDGDYYGIPTKLDIYGIVINKNMFDAAGIPIPQKWTFSEFRDIAKRLTRGEGSNKVYGMFLNSQQDFYPAYFVPPIDGGNWIYRDGGKSSAYDLPSFRAYVEFYNNLMNVDKSAPTHIDSVTQKLTQEGMFLSGRSAMTIGPWMIRSIKDLTNYPHDFVTAFAPYPTPDGMTATYSQGGAGDIVSINPKSRNIDAAWEYVKWYSTKGMIEVAKGGRVPLYTGYDAKAVTAAFLDGAEKLFDAGTTQSVLIAPRNNYASQTITIKLAELGEVQREELEAILNGIKTVDQGIRDMKSRSDRILAQ
jgi:multiple sugar transport system substrate-binding protein